MNRRAFLKSGACSAASLWMMPLASSARAQASGPVEAKLLAEASARIEEIRMGAGTIVVRDAAGKPVPGAKIRIEQLRHDFLFGCNFFMFGRCGDAEAEEAYRSRFAAVFNYCTLGFYWAAYEREQGKPAYEYTDKVVAWAQERGLACKGHPLVWDHPAGSPRWLPEDNEQLDRLSKKRVRDIVTRYKGRINFWDVVNEATHLPDKVNNTRMAAWGLAKGPVEYMAEHLKEARAANPGATLLVNDYRTDPPYLRLLEQLREETDKPFDVVGIQSHMHDGLWNAAKTWGICQTHARLGCPLHFTETTLVSGRRRGPGESWEETTAELEQRQAGEAEQFYTLLFSHPAVQAITWWDFSDRGAWQRAAAGWLRKDMSPKPVYERMTGLIKDCWWTRTEATTNAGGSCGIKAFYGTYRVQVQAPGDRSAIREVHWEKGGTNYYEFTLV